MKIALLTIHYANSYGGMLQAYASKTILERFGDVKFLNYRTKHLADNMRVVSWPNNIREVLRAGKNLLRYFPRRRLLNRFSDFQNAHFSQTDILESWDDLKDQSRCFDVFISGSDQIWNPKVIEAFDPAYFLGFVSGKKKIAFASSAGSYRYSDQEASRVTAYLEDFSGIGVREPDLNIYLKCLLGREDIETVLDPTLLLSGEDWRRELGINNREPEVPYVLIYALKLDRINRVIVDNITRELGLHVIAIDQEPFVRYRVDEHRNDLGPKEYLDLIANASFVVTDSFHGTAFSINFNVPFVSIPPYSGINRIQTLLTALNLNDRLVSQGQIPSLSVDFGQANTQLEELRKSSLFFIKRQLVE